MSSFGGPGDNLPCRRWIRYPLDIGLAARAMGQGEKAVRKAKPREGQRNRP